MDRRGFPKPKITHAQGFKVVYQDRGYQCTGEGGSLKVGCRRLLYCPDCDAAECVFGGPTFKQVQTGAKAVVDPEKRVVSGAQRELYSRSSKRNVKNKRALGLTPSGKPLARVCYNCLHVRKCSIEFYICQHRPLGKWVREWTMRTRYADKIGCRSFEMRLVVEVEKLGKG